MKRLFIFILVAGLLTACVNDKSQEKIIVDKTKIEDNTGVEVVESQVELNNKLKEEAKEYSFTELNGDEVEKDTKVKLIGKVGKIMKEGMLGEFTLMTVEEDLVAMFTIVNVLGADVSEGSFVTVYGTYQGKDDSGMPKVESTLIEVD